MNRFQRARLLVLLPLSAALAGALAQRPPLAQPLSGHDFADQRVFFGVPNFLNVVSNLALLLATPWGWACCGALVTERFEQPLFALGQLVSGHTIKHLLVTLAVYQVIRMLRTRTST